MAKMDDFGADLRAEIGGNGADLRADFAKLDDEIALLERLICFKSITPCDDGALDFIADFMGAAGWSAEWFNGGEGAAATKNLLLRRDFLTQNVGADGADGANSNLAGAGGASGANSNLAANPPVKLCFAGHIDVVPTDEFWTREPFLPTIEPCENVVKNGEKTSGENPAQTSPNSNLDETRGEKINGKKTTAPATTPARDEWLYGRGAQDMKGGVAAILTACRRVRHFGGEVMILLTSDEEGDGAFGTRFALAQLARRGDLPDFALVAEPTCAARFGDIVKVGRRGSINGVLRVRGRSGHAAYPQKCANPAHFAAPALARLAGAQLAAADGFFEPTTLVVTDIRGGLEVCNVTPSELRVMFNVRNAPSVTLADVERAVLAAFGDVGGDFGAGAGGADFVGAGAGNEKVGKNIGKNGANSNLADNDGAGLIMVSANENPVVQISSNSNLPQPATNSSVAQSCAVTNPAANSNLAQNPVATCATPQPTCGANSNLAQNLDNLAATPATNSNLAQISAPFAPQKSAIQRTFGDFEFELALSQPSQPFLTDPAAPALRALTRIIARRCGGEPELNCAGGTSDARHFAALGVAVAEFGTRNDTIHACDERVSTREVRELTAIFAEFLGEF